MLLEFFPGSDDEFVNNLLAALNDIHPKVNSMEDLWMNDEVLLHITSEKGAFDLSKDIWGYVFIMAKNNQGCLKVIDQILSASSQFEKEEVDFEKYKK